MTATIETTVKKGRLRAPATMAGAFASAFVALTVEASIPQWPNPIYADRPVDFAQEVLGVELLPEQQAILQALAKPNARVTVASGHKCGKDFIASIAACYYFCSFDGARVQLTAPTYKQVHGITWREIRMRVRNAIIPICKSDEIGELASTGIVAHDFREIKGFTAKTAEAVAGISAPHVLYIVTEASGVEDPIYEAIEGNLAGKDARILLITNPTRKSGYFYDSHHKNSKQWKTFHLSSWDIAASHQRSGLDISALATVRYCQERLEAWGKDDPRYRVRVLGEFVELEQDLVVPLDYIEDAQARWDTTKVLDSDTLHVGVDPAGGGRDETAVAIRRGRKILSIQRWRESDYDRNAELVLQAVIAELAPGERGSVVKVDKGGEGWKLVASLRKACGRWDPAGDRIRIDPIDFGWRPRRPASYLRLRDELWFTLRDWLKEGGAIPEDEKLEEELITPQFYEDIKHRLNVESKDEIRKRIGRSTDSADAVILAVWPHGEYRDWGRAPAPKNSNRRGSEEGGGRQEISPYDSWQRQGPSPYDGWGQG